MTTTAASPKFSRGKEEGNNPRFAVHDFHGYVLKDQDREILMKLTVPVPYDEAKRIEILRESKLLDGPTTDTAFDRLTTLTARLLKVMESH